MSFIGLKSNPEADAEFDRAKPKLDFSGKYSHVKHNLDVHHSHLGREGVHLLNEACICFEVIHNLNEMCIYTFATTINSNKSNKVLSRRLSYDISCDKKLFVRFKSSLREYQLNIKGVTMVPILNVREGEKFEFFLV